MVDPNPDHQSEPPIDSLSGLLLIMFGKALGYVLLLVFALVIVRRPPWQFSLADVLFWSCAAAIPLARHYVSRRYDAQVLGRAPIPLVQRIGTHLGAAAVLWILGQSVHIRW